MYLHSQGEAVMVSEHDVSKQLANGPKVNTEEQKKAPGASMETTPDSKTDVAKPAVVNGVSKTSWSFPVFFLNSYNLYIFTIALVWARQR